MSAVRLPLRLLALATLMAHLTGAALLPTAVCHRIAEHAQADDECCPPGTHPKGMCPMQSQKNRTNSGDTTTLNADCRLVCGDSEKASILPINSTAPLPERFAVVLTYATGPIDVPVGERPRRVSASPPSPPPRA